MSVNKVILLGALGQDPEVKYMQNGNAVANFSLATNETWKDKDGKRQEKTEWHRCVAFRKPAEIIGEYCKKGSQLYVEGQLATRKWQDKEGNDRYTTEINVKEFKFVGGGRGQESRPKEDPAATAARNAVPDDEDIPF